MYPGSVCLVRVRGPRLAARTLAQWTRLAAFIHIGAQPLQSSLASEQTQVAWVAQVKQ